jgi:hypothetical protein
VVLAYSWRSMVYSIGKEHGQNRRPTYPHTGVLACPQATKKEIKNLVAITGLQQLQPASGVFLASSDFSVLS